MQDKKNVYQAPNARVNSVDFDDEANTKTWYHLTGRIGRLRYLTYQLVVTIIFYIAMAIIGVVFGLSADPNSPIGLNVSGIAFLAMLLLFIPLLVYQISYMVRRLHDFDQSGWLALLMLVPLVNFIFMLFLMFKGGTEGENSFGAPPRENRWWHWIGAFAIPALFFIGMSAGFIAASSGM